MSHHRRSQRTQPEATFQSAVKLAACLLSIGWIAACDSLLEVDLPGRLPAAAIEDPKMVGALMNGIQADFECAYSSYSARAGIYTDEFESASHWFPINAWAQRLEVIDDHGNHDCLTTLSGTSPGAYLPLQRARFQAETGLTLLQGFAASGEDVPDLEEKLATAAAYAGYALTLLGEGYCSMALDGGAEMQPSEVLAIAEARFTSAIQNAESVGAEDIVNWVSVGRARVRVQLGDGVGALQDANRVPQGFVKYTQHESAPARRANVVAAQNHVSRQWSLNPELLDLEVEGVPDSRLPSSDPQSPGQDGINPWFQQGKYTSPSSPMRLATWEEAQFIIAEIEGGQEAVDAINRVRDHWGLPPFASTDDGEILEQLLHERRITLFGEGQRLADMIRFAEVPWPTGDTHSGPINDERTCIPLPLSEVLNNPNLGR